MINEWRELQLALETYHELILEAILPVAWIS